MRRKSLAIVSLVLLSIIAMSIFTYNLTFSKNGKDDNNKSLLIIEAILSSRELQELILSLNGETYVGTNRIEIKPGFYEYTAHLDNKVVTGSIEVANDATLLYIHFPEKQSTMIGVGGQPRISTSDRYIAYNHGPTINIYDIDEQKTLSLTIPENSSFFIEGWANDELLVISDLKDSSTWIVSKTDTSWELNKIVDEKYQWANNFKLAATSNSDLKDIQVVTSSEKVPTDYIIYLGKGYDIAAISPQGTIAYFKTDNPSDKAQIGISYKSSLYIYDINSEEKTVVSDDSSLALDLVSFSSNGRFLTYITIESNSNNLMIYDTFTGTFAKLYNAGIWWDWDQNEQKIIWVNKPGQLMMYDIITEEHSLIYSSKPDNSITKVLWLDETKLAFIEEGQLNILDLASSKRHIIAYDAHFIDSFSKEDSLLFISDFNFILTTDY